MVTDDHGDGSFLTTFPIFFYVHSSMVMWLGMDGSHLVVFDMDADHGQVIGTAVRITSDHGPTQHIGTAIVFMVLGNGKLVEASVLSGKDNFFDRSLGRGHGHRRNTIGKAALQLQGEGHLIIRHIHVQSGAELFPGRKGIEYKWIGALGAVERGRALENGHGCLALQLQLAQKGGGL